MIHEIELLNLIHQNADMGRDSTKHIIKLSNDVEFLHTLNSHLDEYEQTYDSSGRLLQKLNVQPEDASTMTKTMAHISSTMKSLVAPSTSKLAEMIIDGSTMGVTNLSKQISAYCGKNQEVLEIAKKQLLVEEKNIEEMKKYL